MKALEEMKTGKTVFSEFRYITKTGKTRWVWGFLKRYRDIGIVNFIDITRQKKLREELEKSERFYRSLIDDALAAMYIVQGERIVFANKMMEELTGYSLEELMSRNAFEFVHPEDRELVYRRNIERQAGLRGLEEYDFRVLTKPGVRWITIRARPIIFNDKPAAYVTAIDTTRLHEANEKLRKVIDFLITLSSIMRHDVLNELAVIRGAIELGEEKLLEKALRSSDSIVQKLEDSKAIEMAVGELKSLKVHEVVGKVIEKHAGNPDIRFNIELEEIEVQANEALEFVIDNVIQNSIMHGNVKPITIEIKAFKDGDCCVLRIADNGVGIPAEIKEKLFKTRVSTRKGGGLGLMLVKKIVEYFDGTITAYDNPQGAVFEIRFPLKGAS